jgi:sugar phosphate isomerase/epimerase
MIPKIAMINIFQDTRVLKVFAMEHGFDGIDWSFDLESLPEKPLDQSNWVRDISRLNSMEVRFHCPFNRFDLGHNEPAHAKAAQAIFRRIIRLVSRAGGRFLTIHIGLGRDSTEPLSWDATINSLRRLVHYGAESGVKVCLENLAWGWTSKPNLFEKIIRKSGAGVTLDIGHAEKCEAVRSHYYAPEDFITPHADRLFNAHVYHKEVEGRGHLPPEGLEDIRDRLDLLRSVGCEWWTLELRTAEELLRTKTMIDRYLEKFWTSPDAIRPSPDAIRPSPDAIRPSLPPIHRRSGVAP